MLMQGCLSGLRCLEFRGKLVVKDKKNGIYAVIHFIPTIKRKDYELFNKSFPNRRDFVLGFITKNADLI